MTCRGRVQDGVVVPEAGTILPEGAEVRIDVTSPAGSTAGNEVASGDGAGDSIPSMYNRYKNVIGAIKDLPADASERVDELLYGPSDS